ncbi:MAG: RNA polymerase sporulation sigma factor SigH [Lachnospiraceae bacterium]|nr:RNA polymerase sporulation sigma factor SigH [Lachnospiraceae bacterium]
MNEEYQQYSDEELMIRLRDGETGIMDFIMNKYKNLVRSKAQSMYILGADNDDLIQEGMIGLFKAVRDFDSGRDASFYTFADLCISRQMYTAVQASRRQKHIPLNTYVSLYATTKEDPERSEGDMTLVNMLALKAEQSPEEMLIDKENVEQLEKTIEKELSGFEKQVLDLYLTGMRYTQIAKVLGRDEKSTDNALQRIKTKLRKAIYKKTDLTKRNTL